MQFTFLPTSNLNQSYGPVCIIDDGCQPKIEIASKDRNIIAATFTHFLLKNIGGSETFKDKQDFFYHEVRKYHSNFYHEKLLLKVNREQILESSLKATKRFSVADWCGNFEGGLFYCRVILVYIQELLLTTKIRSCFSNIPRRARYTL